MKRKDYYSPETATMALETERLICESGGFPDSIINDMDVSATINGDDLFE